VQHRLAIWHAAGLRSFHNAALVVTLTLLALLAGAPAAQAAPKQSYIVIDHATGQVLASSEADAERYPASLTKMMTLYMLFDALKDGRVTMKTLMKTSAYASRQAPTKLNLSPGDMIPVETAIQALVVRSANDVAMVVAEHLGGSEAEFARQMTRRAGELGMRRTVFRNPHGLPNSGQHTTARDLSTLARALLRDYPRYYSYFATEQFSFQGVTYRTHNRLMQRYPGMDGLKTGFINASGFNLTSSVVRDGRRLVGVVMGGQTAASRDKTMERLLDAAFLRPARKPEPSLLMVSAPPPRPGAIGNRAEVIESNDMAQDGIQEATMIMALPSPRTTLSSARASRTAVDSSWAIQIGAFGSAKQTNAALKIATDKLPTLADYDGVVVPGKNTRGRSIYRARFLGLTQKQAMAACSSLRRVGGDCLAMRSNGES
jgi:D-alanyl-D-alanine carboxypeptidase